jgi:hypothetical protein
MKTTEAPLGDGFVAPSNVIYSVQHQANERVEWQLDSRGWAVGYRIITNAD